MKNSISLLSVAVTLTGVVAANRFVTGAGVYPAAAGNAIGATRSAGIAGEKVTTDVIGTATIETGGAIAAGAAVETDATGRAVTLASGVKLARLAPGESATAAGQFVEVLLIQN
jgi:hypothetical protein